MIAVTVSVFGAKQATSRWQGTALSAVFVLGIVAMFVPLGVVMGLTGNMMGSLLQSPIIVVAISLLFVVMALSMFGLFDLELPPALQDKLSGVGGVGYRGAFLLGLVSGVVAAPCTGPFLTGMLAWIAQTQSAVQGALAMGAFALGLGTPFFLVGAFAMQLPKSGKWMVHVKTVLGVVLLLAAFYFLGPQLELLTRFAARSLVFIASASALALLGIVLVLLAPRLRERWVVVGKAGGALIAALGLHQLITAALLPTGSLNWQELSLEDARARAREERKPLFVDFTAAWCTACKELDRFTFSDPRVSAEASRFVAVKVDLTDAEDPRSEAAKAAHKIAGLPTVLLFDSAGNEVVRCTDFVAPERFLPFVEQVR
jgi:thiol:disulfide interchange protein DsbD